MSVDRLSDEDVIITLHDPCDIRKEYSEKLGIVRDLNGKFINGYSTFNMICVNGDGKRLHLSDITVYRNGDKAHYVKQSELDELVKKQVASCQRTIQRSQPKSRGMAVLDRQFDGAPLFEFITHHLNDKCVIRLKISRNSNEKSINEDGKEYAVKLKYVPLTGKWVDTLDKVRIR